MSLGRPTAFISVLPSPHTNPAPGSSNLCMPEEQVSKGIKDMVVLGKGMDGTIAPAGQLYRLEVVTVTLSKKQGNLEAVKEYDWHSPTEDEHWETYAPNPSWLQRADELGLGHLMAIVPYAPLICRSRGKLGCFAAGPHAVVICYAMETNVIGMPVELYRSIIQTDFPGPNADRERAANELRVFHLPENCIEPYSSREKRTMKIQAAFVSERWAWVITDFSSLVIMRVFSRNATWTEEDLTPGTDAWDTIFKSIGTGGPDWVTETALAKTALRKWRSNIMKEYSKRHLQPSLKSFLQKSNDPKDALITNPSMSYARIFRPIFGELLSNRFNSFSGIGNYSASELLHQLALHPFTPAHIICEDNGLFEKFEDGIYVYLSQFSSPLYRCRGSSVANTTNPFAFNNHLHDEFLSKWVKVYKRTKAVVPVELHNRLVQDGLLDDQHVIGTVYQHGDAQMLDPSKRKWCYHPVFKCHGVGKLCAYTVICARPPDEWELEYQLDLVARDIQTFSYQTTIGPAQFRVPVQNRPYYEGVEPGTLAIGRPKITYTGKAGRPRKGVNKSRLARYSSIHRGRPPHTE